MVVDEFDVVSVIVFPAEAEPPLTIDANAELPSTISLQRFQSIAGRRAQTVNAVAAWSCCILASVSAARRDEMPFRGA
jgi:hypothetical protein